MIWKESGQMMFRSFCMGKKDNDREINEWYNEVNWDDRLEVIKVFLWKELKI